MISVGVCLSTRDWSGRLQRHCRDHVADVLVTPLHDARDAFEGGIEIVLVDDETSWLTPPFVDRTRVSGISIIGLFTPGEEDGFGRTHLERLGVGCTLPADTTPEQLVEAIRRCLPDVGLRQAFTDLVQDDRASSSTVIAVGGPAGAGVTEVSIGLAQLLAATASTVLVDLDDTHPSVGRRLGLAIQPNLLDCLDAVLGVSSRPDGGLTPLERTVVRGAEHRPGLPFDTVVGLARRDDWDLVEGDDVLGLIEALRHRWSIVVARLGPSLEDLSRHVHRHALSRSGASCADHVVGVCDASPVGLLRFADWLVDALALVGDRPVDVVVNRSPSAPGARAQVREQLGRMLGRRLGVLVHLGHDRGVARAAWNGGPIESRQFLRRLAALTAEHSHV